MADDTRGGLQDKDNDEFGLVEALANVLTVWPILTRYLLNHQKLERIVVQENNRVIEAFLKAVLAPPYGERAHSVISGLFDASDPTSERDSQDTRLHYGEILGQLGNSCRLSGEEFSTFMMRRVRRLLPPAHV